MILGKRPGTLGVTPMGTFSIFCDKISYVNWRGIVLLKAHFSKIPFMRVKNKFINYIDAVLTGIFLHHFFTLKFLHFFTPIFYTKIFAFFTPIF